MILLYEEKKLNLDSIRHHLSCFLVIPAYIEQFKNRNLSDLSKLLDITIAQFIKIINELEAENYIHTLKSGRERYVRLTTKGEKLSEAVKKVIECIQH